MFRFTIRDLLWLMVVVGMALAWWLWWRSIPVDATVSGNVLIAGKPLANGRIYFHSADGQISGAKVTKGEYAIHRMLIGRYRTTLDGENVPPRYTGDHSELSLEVRRGKNVFDLSLK